MVLYRISSDALERVATTTFGKEQIRERADLQRLLRQRIDIFGDDLLVVAEEYALFQDSRRRVDLLAVDRAGTLVVIELKRTDDGGHMELQALRYAAMVSTMTFEHLVDAYSHYNAVDAQEARDALQDWIDEASAPEELSDKVRIVLVSADFSTEITSTVLWLNQQYATDISCYRLVPYRLGSDVLLDIQQIIPLPEATDFQVQQRRKGATVAAARAAGEGSRDFTKYDLTVGDTSYAHLSKQGAVKRAVDLLYQAGVPLGELRDAALGQRWRPTHPDPEETLEQAFRREHPARKGGWWFDLDLRDGDVVWVMPRIGGLHTERFLAELEIAAAAHDVRVSWSRAGETPLPPGALVAGDDEDDDAGGDR